MSAVFLSHSSQDRQAALEIKAVLERHHYTSVFLDFDPECGIPSGADWEQELYARLRACQAVVALCSRHSLASRWCLVEITHAKALGKHVFPVQIDGCTVDAVLRSRQAVDLARDPQEGYARLIAGLKAAGLDPGNTFAWDRTRPPFPGLMAFEEQDAGVYFGRDREIHRGLEQLNRLRDFGGARSLMILGASGCGKSSLLRAGLVPRLRRDGERWLVVPPMRPGRRPLWELAISFAQALRPYGRTISPEAFVTRVRSLPRGPAATLVLLSLADTLREASGQRTATVLITIDQAEELLTYTREERAEATELLHLLGAALQADRSPFMGAFALRSDFLGELQQHEAFRSLGAEPFSLDPIPPDQLIRVIEQPAMLAGVQLERGLTEAILKDAEAEKALPLLAFTLRELYDKHASDGFLSIEEYRDRLGGVAGSVVQAAELVYSAKPLRLDEALELRRAFRSLAGIDATGNYVRQIVAWDRFSERVRHHLERFIQARLLVASGEGFRRTVEVAHESIFRSWRRLRAWLDEDRAFLLWKQRLAVGICEWRRRGEEPDGLLRGSALAEAEPHFHDRQGELSALELNYIRRSFEQRSAELAEKENSRLEGVRLKEQHDRLWRTMVTIILVPVMLAVGGIKTCAREPTKACVSEDIKPENDRQQGSRQAASPPADSKSSTPSNVAKTRSGPGR